jgi:putative Mg2+ transporter-C (MgtC) family protein
MTGMWDAVLGTLANEFSDMAGIEQFARLMLRLLLAAILGFALGFEREVHGKAAGARTHMLVAIGSALFMLVALEFGSAKSDMSRVIQGLLSGVGFLCAGTIFRQGQSERGVHGLTTAAGLWMTAAIGMACGLGRGLTALLSTLLALLVLAGVPRFARALGGVMGPPPANDDES